MNEHWNDKHVFSCVSISLYLPERPKFGYVAAVEQNNLVITRPLRQNRDN
jgi:hypothetical protein